nr:copper amine oxidase N-terminal domain-containing protein [Paenibacillus alba]
MEKDALFAQLAAVQEVAAELPPDAAVQPLLEQQVSELLGKLQQQEKAKYSAAELEALADLSARLADTKAIDLGPGSGEGSASVPSSGLVPIAIQPIAAENVLSPNIYIKFDAPPVIINGQAYLPIRSVSESFGAAVDWEQESMTVTVSSDSATITCRINDATAYIDGEPFQIEAPALLLAGKTYVPLRFISESLGLQVDWNAPTQIIQIAN